MTLENRRFAYFISSIGHACAFGALRTVFTHNQRRCFWFFIDQVVGA